MNGRRVALALAALACAALALALAWRVARGRGLPPARVVAVEGESRVLPRVDASSAPAEATSSAMRSLDSGGRTRDYLLVTPAHLDPSRRYPLVLVFHGDGGDARSFHRGFPFERATGEDAIVAYPDGINATWDLDTKIDNRDIGFVEDLVAKLAAELPVDRARVFGAGYSSGGFLVNLVACRSAGLFRAISSSAGGAPYRQALVWPNGFTRCPGQEPISVIALHGTSDFSVTLASGRFSAAYWAYVDGCDTSEMETTGYEQCAAYRACPAGKAVVFCEVPGLGHWVWDRAAEASWTFFQRQ